MRLSDIVLFIFACVIIFTVLITLLLKIIQT